jgi:hypothetical protein
MHEKITMQDTIGLAKTGLDVHTLGIASISDFLQECGLKTVVTNSIVAKAFSDPGNINNSSIIHQWIIENNITVLSFSYRLNTDDAVLIFQKLMYQLENKKLLKETGGLIKKIFFAGLPEACNKIKYLYQNTGVFYGDESYLESLKIFGIDPSIAPLNLVSKHSYDIALENFGKEIVENKGYISILPVDRHKSDNFGTIKERLVNRIQHGRINNLPPIIRAHSGPYMQNRKESVKQFIDWAGQLASGGLLDILSIGTSQLTQEKFGEEWHDLSNGGGVPINSPEEYSRVYDASRPMLVRTYAGTKNIKKLAKMYENTINIAWHALSLWWFSQIDGRGHNTLLDNLTENFNTIQYIATTGKPYEANVSHHFAFRSSDDVSYIVSAVLAAKAAKIMGINDFILQIMLNDPKQTSGINDLAKARATLKLVRNLEDGNFRVYLQTRVGLDYLSHKTEKAKKQLAAVTALMDDIEPFNNNSPDIIHVVSYSEGNNLATPDIIEESIKITRYSLDKYRALRKKRLINDMSKHPDVEKRMNFLIEEAKIVLTTIESCINDPYSPQGFYNIFKMGFLPVPQLMYCREEFPEAIRWQTKIKNGGVDIYYDGEIISAIERMKFIKKEVLKNEKNKNRLAKQKKRQLQIAGEVCRF